VLRKLVFIAAVSILASGLLGAGADKIDENFTAGGYKLVWADEFDEDGAPNPKNWAFEKGLSATRRTSGTRRRMRCVRAGSST